MAYVDRGDARVWWSETGDGPPLVLINGLSSPSGTWHRMVRATQATHRVITIDNRGVGRTGMPSGPVSVPAMAADVAAVLDAAGAAPAHVVGHSMGGLIAQELAVTFPGHVRSLVLANTHVGMPHVLSLGEAGTPDPAVPAALAAAMDVPAAERMELLRPIIYAPDTSPERIAEDEAVRDASPTDTKGFTAQLVGTRSWEQLEGLGRLKVPTLVLQGDLDRMVPLPHAQRLTDAIPGARLQVLEGAGHQLFTDREPESAEAILDFVGMVEQDLLAGAPEALGVAMRPAEQAGEQ